MSFNTFLKNNVIITGVEIPTSGTFKTGDIVVNIGPNAASEPMWICNEGGTPGVWGPVGVGSGSIVSINSLVTLTEPVNEISLESLGVPVTEKDKLMVHYNSTHLLEGTHFTVDETGTKIVKVGEGTWGSVESGGIIALELFKSVESKDGDTIKIETRIGRVQNVVVVNTNVHEVEIGISNFEPNYDALLVFKNTTFMTEGIDYEISDGKIVCLDEAGWNVAEAEDCSFTFIVIKEVPIIDGNTGEIGASNLKDGSVSLNKLSEDVKQVIIDAGNIDFNEYQVNELNTVSKTIVGSINEIKASIDGLVAESISLLNDITNDL